MAVHFTQQPCASLVGLSISVRFAPLSLCLSPHLSRIPPRSMQSTGHGCLSFHLPPFATCVVTPSLARTAPTDASRFPPGVWTGGLSLPRALSAGYSARLPIPRLPPARCARRNTLPPYLACCVGVRTVSGFLSNGVHGMALRGMLTSTLHLSRPSSSAMA